MDSKHFLRDYQSREKLIEKEGWGADVKDTRSVVQLLVSQVETSDVIVLNKMDLVDAKEESALRALMQTLNPHAQLLASRHGQIARLEAVLDTGLFPKNHERYGVRPPGLIAKDVEKQDRKSVV